MFSAAPWESVTLTAFGRNKMLYFNMLDAARELAVADEQGRTPIYTVRGINWEPLGSESFNYLFLQSFEMCVKMD